MAETLDRRALENRIAELEAQLEKFALFSDTPSAFSAGSCTNTCTGVCTDMCTGTCTGGCVADASIVMSQFRKPAE